MTAPSREQFEADQGDQTSSRSRLLTVTVIVLAVVVLGLGAWTVYGMSSTTETQPTADVQRVVDNYLAAWNSYDGEAFRELVTDDYVLDMVGITESETMHVDEASELVNGLEAFEWNEAVIGEAIMTGDGPYYVSAVEHFTAPGYGPQGVDGISTFTVVNDGGTLRVARHDYTGNN
jgi:hypothetical protein